MRLWIIVASVAVTLALGVGAYLYFRAPEVPADTPAAAIGRLLAGRSGAAVAPWLAAGKVGDITVSGQFARVLVTGENGKTASVLLILAADGSWHVVSVSEGAPSCAAVGRYGFPSALISDCTVGAVSTVAGALASAATGTEVRVFGVVSLSEDPSCPGCVFLSSGGSSVLLNVSFEDLARAGIRIGDAVVVSGGVNGEGGLDATAVVSVSGGARGSGNVGGATGEDAGSAQTPSQSQNQNPGQPPARPPTPEPPAYVPPVNTAPPVPGAPRRYRPTTWYANPLDLDTSGIDFIQLTEH